MASERGRIITKKPEQPQEEDKEEIEVWVDEVIEQLEEEIAE